MFNFIEISIMGLYLFPLIIFLDYHKKHNIHKAIIWLILFYLVWLMLPWVFRIFGIWALLLFPAAIFSIALWRQPNSDTDHQS